MEQVQGMALPEGNRTGPNCGITAVAIAAKVPFHVAFSTIANCRTGLPIGSRKRWAPGTTDTNRRKALEALGVKFEEIFAIMQTWTDGQGTVRLVKGKTVTLESWVLYGRKHDPEKLYMVTTTSHVQMVLGSYVMDQHGAVQCSKFWGKNKRIKGILEIKG